MSTGRSLGSPCIAHLIETDGPGGAERVVAHLAAALQALGTRNVVFVPASGEGWLAEQLRGSGVALEHFRIERPLSRSCAAFLVNAFGRHGAVVVHSHEFSMAVYGGWAAWRTGVPHVITMHGSRYYAQRLRRRLAMRAAVANSARTIAVSSTLARTLTHDLGLPASRVRVVPNGVPPGTPARSRVRAELGLSAQDQLIVAVGNLYPVKGHLFLLDAFARLAPAYPGLHLAIAGRGELRDELSRRARGHRLGARVQLFGLRPDVDALLSAADIFVLPSLSEALPLAVLEAMLAACPIVATDVGDVGRALARGEAGVLVPPADAAALAEAIDGLLRDPPRARALACRAAARARQHYTLERMVARYVRMYRALLARCPGRASSPPC